MTAIVILIAVLIFYLLQAEIYLERCFYNVSFALKFKDQGVFEGEKTELAESIANRKLLPLRWVIAKFAISDNLKFDTEEETGEVKGGANYRKDLFSLGAFEKVNRRSGLTAAKRGYYPIDTATLTTGDIFGRLKFLMDYPVSAQLYVYPSLVNSGELAVPFERMMGEILARRNLTEDPFQIRGIRDYANFDSFRRINWNATARSGELKVNEYDFTSSREIVLLLNMERFNRWDGDGTIEESVRIAATIASDCEYGGVPVGLITNGRSLASGQVISIPASCSPDTAQAFYQELACLDTSDVSGPFAAAMEEVILKGDTQPLYVLVSQYFGEDLQEEVANMKRHGFNLFWILPKNPEVKTGIDDEDGLLVWDVRDR